jgi:hypothetical protein
MISPRSPCSGETVRLTGTVWPGRGVILRLKVGQRMAVFEDLQQRANVGVLGLAAEQLRAVLPQQLCLRPP